MARAKKKVAPESEPELQPVPKAPESAVAKVKPDFEIHVRRLEVQGIDRDTGAYSLELETSSLLCGKRFPTAATAILAPLDHPAYCPTCKAEKAKLKAGARYAVVMFRTGE